MADSSFFKNNGTSSQLQSSASASAAAALASEQAALASENAAQTSKTDAATSAASALVSKNAAASSAASANSDATAAAASAVTSQTAASSSSANVALTSADAIATAADRVQTGLDATASASSASAANTSASAASASQIAAASSAASAAAVFSDFEDRYYGPHASDSAAQTHVTGLGLTVDQGDLYFNSTANEMRVYDGGSWVAASSAGGASLINYNYTATASQTAFTGSDDNSNTLSYTVDNLIVTRNGVVLEDGTDYTATDGSTITLSVAAAAGDEINVVAFKSFTTADMVSATNGGTFQSNVTVNGTMTATAFSGDGSALTNLPAAGISDVVQDTTPQLGGNLDTNGNDVNFGDNDKAIFGAGSDLQIYHDGLNSYVQDTGAGDIIIKGDNVRLQDSAGGNLLVADTNDAVQLYYGYNQKLATTATGVDVTGTVTASSNVTSKGGQLRINDGTTALAGGMFTHKEITGGGTSNDTVIFTETGNKIRFATNGSVSDKVVIDTAGNVGIGTTSPASPTGFGTGGVLHLKGSTNNDCSIVLEGLYGSGGRQEIGVSSGALQFYRGAATGSMTESMRIDSSGNVGIGTSPSELLHIRNASGDAAVRVQGNTRTFNIQQNNYGLRFVDVNAGSAERLRINAAGIVTMPYQPAFVAVDGRGQGQQAIASINISQYFTTAQTNIGNGFSTSTGRFTAPVAGYYVFGWNLFTTGISADTTSRVGIIKNGNSSAGEWSGGDRVGHANQGSIGIYLNANDYITLGTQGGSYTAYWYADTQHSRFWGYLLG
jgi:hypothetical protein